MKYGLLSLLFVNAVAAFADIAISPSSIDLVVGGGGATIKTSGEGTWVATKDVDWITLVKTSGNAGTSCQYMVSRNPNADTRIGHITISGNIYTVTQQGCPVALSPSSADVNRLGGSGTITCTVDAGVLWTVEPSDSWITVTPASGSGPTVLSFTIAAYDQVGSRNGTIRIGSEKFLVQQTGVDVTLNPVVMNVTKDVCILPIQVVAMAEQQWSVTPNASWLSVLDAGNGFGGSQISIAVAENPSFQKRTGTVSVGTAVLTVVQDGTDDVAFKILPEVAEASPKGSFGNVAVYATPDAGWSAESEDSWIKITSGAEGAGNGNVKYVAMSNPDLTNRTGHIRFTPPAYKPELDLYAGLILWIKEQDNIEGNEHRSTTYPLSKRFDGSFSNPLTGASLPAKEDNDFALSFSFEVDQVDCLNRLATIGNLTLYVNDENVLCVNGSNLNYRVETAGEWHTVVLNFKSFETTSSLLSIYVGARDSGLVCVGKDMLFVAPFSFSSGVEITQFQLGRGVYPASGNLAGGAIGNLRIWSRLLSERECELADQEQYVAYETRQKGAPVDCKFDYYSFGMNAMGIDEESEAPYQSDKHNISALGWIGADSRWRCKGRAVASTGSGRISFGDFGSMFDVKFKVNNGLSFPENYDYNFKEASGTIVGRYPFPVEYTKMPNATWSFWLKIDEYPKPMKYASLFSRSIVDTNLYDNCRKVIGPEYFLEHRARDWSDHVFFAIENNSNWLSSIAPKEFGLNLLVASDGSLVLEQAPGMFSANQGNKSIKIIADTANATKDVGSIKMTRNKWHLLTFVGKSRSSIQVFIDGDESFSASTEMVFSNIKPIDLRTQTRTDISGQDTFITLGEVVNLRMQLSVGGWNGALDELAFYDRALTTQEIKDIYEAGLPAQDVYHTVNQGIQEPTLTPVDVAAGKMGVTTNIEFACAQSVKWTVAPNVDWLSAVGETSGTGPATLSVKVEKNPTCVTRVGMMSIGNKTLTVTQEGLSLEVAASQVLFDSEASQYGSMGTIDVAPEGNGSWTASADVDWIACMPESDSGSGTVYFWVDDFDDPHASRSGTITIGEKTIVITQRGYDLSIEPAIGEVGGNAGAGEIGVAADDDALWTAISTVPWITITSGQEGVSKGTIHYTYTDNTTGQTRTGRIRVGGEEFMLTQACTLKLTTKVVGEGSVTGGGDYAQGREVSLTAIPAKGYEFSHWSGDVVGVTTNTTVIMDTVKNVTATFIPESAAQELAEKKAAQGGFYTRDQIHNLEVGNLVLDVDSSTGKARIGVQLQETSNLSHPNWKPVEVSTGDLDIGNDGTVGIKATATGNAKFFRVVTPSK